MDTKSKTRKKSTTLPDIEFVKVQYADIFLKDERVIFKCSLCNTAKSFICDDFITLMDHLINKHTGKQRPVIDPLYDGPKTFINDNGEELCAAIFFTTSSQLLYRCANCSEEQKEFPKLLEHLLQTHYTESSAKRSGLSSLVPTDQAADLHEIDDECYKIELDEESEKKVIDKKLFLQDVHSIVITKDVDESGLIPNEVVDKNYTKQEDGLYVCKFCPSRFRKRYHVRKHLQSHRTERRFLCHICNKAFKEKDTCSAHVKRHIKEKQHQCTECSAKFHMPSQLRVHIEAKHQMMRNFMCADCGKTFSTSANLSKHITWHKNIRPHKCEKCHKKFKTLWTLRKHELIHSDERAHQCTQCEKKFKQSNALVAHMKLHQNLKEYKCKLCGDQFNQCAGLHSHMKTRHKIADKITIKINK